MKQDRPSIFEMNLENLQEHNPEPLFNPKEEISEKDFDGMKSKLKSLRDNQNWWGFTRLAANILTLFPEKREELGLSEEEFDDMKSILKSARDNKNWWNFAWLAANILTLFPEKRDELGLGKEEFDGMKSVLKSARDNKDWESFTWLARNAYLLAHKRIEVTRDGLRLIPLDPPPPKSDVPPEPVMRNF